MTGATQAEIVIIGAGGAGMAAAVAALEKGARSVVLIEKMGSPGGSTAMAHDIFAVDFTRFSLADGLASLGIAPADVTDVILTHLHFDHAGGSVERRGDELALTFPRATHYLQRTHWDWAMQPSDRDRASFLPESRSAWCRGRV